MKCEKKLEHAHKKPREYALKNEKKPRIHPQKNDENAKKNIHEYACEKTMNMPAKSEYVLKNANKT